MKLIPNLEDAWKLFSVWVAGFAVAFGLLPETLQAAVLGAVGVSQSSVPAVIGVLFIVARLIKQTPDEPK